MLESNQESRNQAKIVHDSESLQQELIVGSPSDHYLDDYMVFIKFKLHL